METLTVLILKLDALDDSLTIYASRPWSPTSSALAAHEPKGGGIPLDAKERNLEYFLEVFLAKEFLKGWRKTASPSAEDIVARIIHYAEFDA